MAKHAWLLIYSAVGYLLSAIALPWAFALPEFHRITPVRPATTFGLTAVVICVASFQVVCALTLLARVASKWNWSARARVWVSLLNLIPWFAAGFAFFPLSWPRLWLGSWGVWAVFGLGMTSLIAVYARRLAISQDLSEVLGPAMPRRSSKAEPDSKSQLKLS